MSALQSPHKVYVYMQDYTTLCTEINEHRQIETGGNLFGLWTTSGSAVIHVVLGPGENWRRTDTSFHQDIEYLKRVGRFLNEKYMLCHIGEWHSHDCLSLSKPSRGDEPTIERNFPRGMTKFLVITANIKDRDQIVLSPYFFTHDGKRYELAEFVFLEPDNPFSKITAEIKQVAEATKCQANETTSAVAIANPGAQISSGDGVNPRNTRSNTGQSCSAIFTHSQASPTYDRAKAVTTVAPQSAIAQDQVILKDVYDEVTRLFSKEGKVDIVRTSNGVIDMTFQHGHYHWMLRFPEKFPNQAAKIYRALTPRELSNCSPCRDYYLEKPLANYVNIILSIKNNCDLLCNVCQNISKERLIKGAPAVLSVKPTLEDVVKEVKDEILTLDRLSFLTSKARSEGGYRIIFDHNCIRWHIEFPAEFPDKPAELFKYENRCGAWQEMQIKLPVMKNEERPLVSLDLIMLAIRTACGCTYGLQYM